MFFKTLRCSFCGRHESEVAKLVAGPRVYICDRCAYETVRIMETTPIDPERGTRSGVWKRVADWLRPSRPLNYGRLA